VFYIQGSKTITVCMADAPFMVNGSSFCGKHVKDALMGATWDVPAKKEHDS
jgi:hypothetical protein